MRSESLLLAAAVCLLPACTPMQWVKADTAPEQLNQDVMQCQQDAWREARLRFWYYRPIGAVGMRDAAGRSFIVPFGDPFGDPFLEEGRLAHFCMRSKGYELAPVEPEKRP